MALPTPTQTKTGTGTSSNPAPSFSSGTTAGNLLIAMIGNFGGGSNIFPSSVTDDKSQTWTLIDQLDEFTGTNRANGSFYYMANTVSGVKTVTGNGLTGTTLSVMIIAEYPLTGSSPLDVHTVAGGTNTSPASGNTGTPTQANELVIGWAMALTLSSTSFSSPNPSNDATTVSNGSTLQGIISDKTISSASAQSSSYTLSSGAGLGWVCGVATFKIPAASSTSHLLSSLGAGG